MVTSSELFKEEEEESATNDENVLLGNEDA